jgi:hypothetical protein
VSGLAAPSRNAPLLAQKISPTLMESAAGFRITG